MLFRHTLVLSSLVLAAAVTFALPSRTNASTVTMLCDEGAVSGQWIHPKDGEPGKASGKLVPDGAPDAQYVFNADVYELPPACNLCINGVLEGKLEVLASGVTYRVSGSYSGSGFARRGTYHLDITTPLTDVWVGEINGNWQHKQGKPFGPVDGQFTICQ